MSNGVAFESNDLQYSPHMREVWGRLASNMEPDSVLLNAICQMRHDTFVGMVLLDAKCEYVNPMVCLPPIFSNMLFIFFPAVNSHSLAKRASLRSMQGPAFLNNVQEGDIMISVDNVPVRGVICLPNICNRFPTIMTAIF